MKKTPKPVESVEVTPNQKKLKQARLPFMLLSDVSPKTESPPTRKRKLSAPEATPVTKVGRISKENGSAEDLVVISDEDSKGLPSPKKQDKVPNPYLKLVDAARKKKIQKNKGLKKSKSRSGKEKSRTTSENDTPKEKNQNSECNDVKMMEVDIEIPEGSEPKSDKSHKSDIDDTPTKKTNNNSKENEVIKSQRLSRATSKADKKDHLKNDVQKSPQKKVTPIVSNIEGVVCIDDSNGCSDVNMPPSNNSDLNTPIESKDSKQELNSQELPILDTKESENNAKSTGRKKSQPVKAQPKSSPRNKSKNIDTKSKLIDKIKLDSVVNTIVKSDTDKENSDIKVTNDNKSDTVQIEKDQLVKSISLNNEVKSNKSPKKSQNDEITESKSKTSEIVTPKRSLRIKDIEESTLNMSTTSSKLDESMSSDPSTPKLNKSLSETSILDKSVNEATKNLTPKQLAKKLEAAKKKEEREKERLEREMKRQQEKEEKEKQRKEKEEQKKKEREEKEEAKKREKEEKEEAKKKEREEKEEQKKKEREEKERQKELERKEKEEQKRKEKEDKEEQKRKEKEARDEEKRKKQEALELEKQEQELKKKKAAEAFVNFFVPKQKIEKDVQEKAPISKNSMLSSFTIKGDMRLAPIVRLEISDDKKENLDKFLQEQGLSENLYLKDLKNGTVKPLSSGKTWPLDDKDDDDVMIVEDELPPPDLAGEVITCESAPREKLRPKLLSFHENRRPPYWGTWRKTSDFVKPRRPFGQEKILDYSVDSDSDWEDSDDGESLDGSAAGSDDEGGNDDYELDNEVFVPHGYLSDEEATMDDDDDDVLNLSPETQKARLKHLEDEFESELKKPTEKLKPRLYGLLWENAEGGKPEQCVDALWNYFQKFAMIMDDITPLLQPLPESDEPEKKKIKKKKVQIEGEKAENSPKREKKKKVKAENKEKQPKPKPEAKKPAPNQPGINNFLKKIKPTQIA